MFVVITHMSMDEPSGEGAGEGALAVACMPMTRGTLIRLAEKVAEGLLSFPFAQAVVEHAVVHLGPCRGQNLVTGRLMG